MRESAPIGTVCGVELGSRTLGRVAGQNVSGIAKNHGLAGAVLDCGFGEIRRQL
jgi:hypothetical protein